MLLTSLEVNRFVRIVSHTARKPVMAPSNASILLRARAAAIVLIYPPESVTFLWASYLIVITAVGAVEADV